MHITAQAVGYDGDYGNWLKLQCAEISHPIFSVSSSPSVYSGLVARSVAYYDGIATGLSTTGYAVSAHRVQGNFSQVNKDTYRREYDALVEAIDQVGFVESEGVILLPALGPWSLAAQMELPNGHKVLEDKGALRDLSDNLGHNLYQERSRIAREVGINVQRLGYCIAEPLLLEIVRGSLKPLSKLDSIRPVPEDIVGSMTQRFLTDLTGHDTTAPYITYDTSLITALPPGMEVIAYAQLPIGRDAVDSWSWWLDSGRRVAIALDQSQSARSLGERINHFVAITESGDRAQNIALLGASPSYLGIKQAKEVEELVQSMQ